MKTSREKRKTKSAKNPAGAGLTQYMQEKLAVTVLVIMLALFALAFRIWKIQTEKSEAYNQKVLSQLRYDSRDIPYRRGDITDRNGTILATTRKVYNLILDPGQINSNPDIYLEPTVDLLVSVLGYDREDLLNTIAERSTAHFVRYRKQLSYDEKTAFETAMEDKNKEYRSSRDSSVNRLRVHGVWFEDAYLRQYPNNSSACGVIGFSSPDGSVGVGGIEQYYNTDLTGTPGRMYGYLNDDSNLERVIKEAENGGTIVSTIDMKVQGTIESCISQFEQEMGGNTVACIVMNPSNGEILGMATNHTYDLNDPRNLDGVYSPEEQAAMSQEDKTNACYELWRNFCISDTYEPGSSSKVMTVAGGLESGAINGSEVYNCGGSLEVGGWDIHCSKRTGHGPLTVTEGIMQSCNVVMMRIAQAMGKENFCSMQRLFGFGSSTGIDLPGEAETSTLVHEASDMSSSDLATNSFGQNYNCTMIQMAAAFSSAINGGSYYQPHVVKQVRNAQGSVVRDIQPELVRETCSADTSAFLRNALYRTVSEGTGKAAGVAGYAIGGKTGTAEKYPRKNGNYLVSFCGFAPADNPQVLCYCIVDTPHTEDQAHSTIASGIFHNIMEQILPYLNVFPENDAEVENPAAAALPENEGITDSTTTETEPETQPVVYDTEEYVEGAGDVSDLPGAPAGVETEAGEEQNGVKAESAAADASETAETTAESAAESAAGQA